MKTAEAEHTQVILSFLFLNIATNGTGDKKNI